MKTDRDAYADGFADGYAVAIKEAPRAKGEWALVKGSNGKDYLVCSNCNHTQEITGILNYCPVCGADMREGEQNVE